MKPDYFKLCIHQCLVKILCLYISTELIHRFQNNQQIKQHYVGIRTPDRVESQFWIHKLASLNLILNFLFKDRNFVLFALVMELKEYNKFAIFAIDWFLIWICIEIIYRVGPLLTVSGDSLVRELRYRVFKTCWTVLEMY